MRKTKAKRTRTRMVQVRLTDTEMAQFEEIVAARGESRSLVLRDALRNYIAEHMPRESPPGTHDADSLHTRREEALKATGVNVRRAQARKFHG
jgi:metal-responsive CopG/Arc/MetJ family transcriptional regulator